jgi:hypothetical protein
MSTIEATLDKVGVPTIDTSFFSPFQTQQLKHTFNSNKSTRILLALEKLSKVSENSSTSSSRNTTTYRTPQLHWTNVQPEARDHMVEYFASKTGSYTNTELESLKKLPVFATQDGSYISLKSNPNSASSGSSKRGERKNQEYYYLKQTDTTLPDLMAGKSRILKRKHGPSQIALYNELGVTELKAVDLFQKFIVPEFDGLSRLDQSKFTDQMCQQWSTLKNNTSLVETLKTLPFIPMNNKQYEMPKTVKEVIYPKQQFLRNHYQFQ